MKRFPYAQNRQVTPEDALGGEWPCAYVQHDELAWEPNAVTPPLATLALGVGCPSPDVERADRYDGEIVIGAIAPPAPAEGYDETFYSDFQALYDVQRHKALALLINMQTAADTHFWFRGANGRSQVVARPTNGAFTALEAEEAVTTARTWTPAGGGTRHEALDVAFDPAHREHALLAVLRSDLGVWTHVASPASGDCDLTGEASLWQTGRGLTLDVWETHGWATWDLLGTAWEGHGAVHPFAHWPSADFAVMLEWLPSGVVACAVSYPTGWEERPVNTKWPRPKAEPDRNHLGYAATGHKQEFARVAAVESLPWGFVEVDWEAFSMVGRETD